jgi:S-adenosylhomocysteine hydrolase
VQIRRVERQTGAAERVKVYETYTPSKDVLREEECLWLIKSTRQGSLSNVGHFNTPPYVCRLLAKHVFNNRREISIIIKGTCSDTM